MENIIWSGEARGVVRCGVSNIKMVNITIPLLQPGDCLSTPGGGPQVLSLSLPPPPLSQYFLSSLDSPVMTTFTTCLWRISVLPTLVTTPLLSSMSAVEAPFLTALSGESFPLLDEVSISFFTVTALPGESFCSIQRKLN